MLFLRQRLPAWAGMLTAGGVLLAATVLAFLVGRFPVSAGDLMQLLWARLSGQDSGLAPAVETVLLQVRGPRVLAALAVGAALSVAGAAFQGLFRNPLVSPDILGASAGAALGAVLAIFLSLGIFAIQGFAFAGGLLAVALVYALGAGLRSADPVLGLLLTGIVIGSLLGAGIVGWVGLVVPHLARALVGPSFPRLLPASALLGGGFLLVIDTLARTLAPVEIPLGVLTAVVGTPFFIALLRSQQRGWA